MQRAKSREPGIKGKEWKSVNGSHVPYILSCMSHILCSLFLFFCGCSNITPPADYYQQVLEMEEYGEQSRRDTGRRPDEIVEPVKDSEPVIVAKSPVQQVTPDALEQEPEEVIIEQPEKEIQEEPENPPQREVVRESSSAELSSVPIAVASDVIKSALRTADLGVVTRTVELVNGRLSGGRNSVRVSFLSDSVESVDEKFVAICAVVYHLNSGANTVDMIVGLAEDRQANLLAIVQSDMEDVAAWMTNEISRADWFSRITRKIL